MDIKFYRTVSGRFPVIEFVDSLSKEAQAQFADAVELLENGKTIGMPLSRPLTNIHRGLHELRLKDRGGIYRVFYYLKVRDAIYMLHSFQKKSQQLPQREIRLIVNRIKEVS